MPGLAHGGGLWASTPEEGELWTQVWAEEEVSMTLSQGDPELTLQHALELGWPCRIAQLRGWVRLYLSALIDCPLEGSGSLDEAVFLP